MKPSGKFAFGFVAILVLSLGWYLELACRTGEWRAIPSHPPIATTSGVPSLELVGLAGPKPTAVGTPTVISIRGQLTCVHVADEALALPPDLPQRFPLQKLPRDLPNRHIPELVPFGELDSPQLSDRVVPLPEANTLAHLNYQERWFGRLQTGPDEVSLFNPDTILVKFRAQPHVGVLRVEPQREWEAVQVLSSRPDVEFAELDIFQERQFLPNDPLIANQWHHARIGSFAAWDTGLGGNLIRIAIVDTPFQMDHPDLVANTISGWDVVANAPVTASAGIVHSTMTAGMAAAAVNNSMGVAGAANCQILPITINGAISEMYNAIIWAADHDVRIVNLSWTGGNSATLEAGAYYHKTKTRGIVAMAGVNGTGFLDYTNQPDLYCISMTDAADNLQSRYGSHIDFAAPGWLIYSTTTGGGYAFGSGTSFATPLFCGVVAWLFSLNPTLGPDEVTGILKDTAVDLGPAGLDWYYGWGRINFAAAATAALATLPKISSIQITNSQVAVTANFRPGLVHTLWRTSQLIPPAWVPVTNVIAVTNGNAITLTDPFLTDSNGFYRVQVNP